MYDKVEGIQTCITTVRQTQDTLFTASRSRRRIGRDKCIQLILCQRKRIIHRRVPLCRNFVQDLREFFQVGSDIT